LVDTPNSTLRGFDLEALIYQDVSGRPVQRYTAELEFPLLEKHVGEQDLILEIGCGHGRTSRILAELTRNQVYAIDYSQEMINQAEKWNKAPNITYLQDDATNIQSAEIKEKQFDLIVAFSCINCISDIDAVFENMAKLLKPNGKILVEAFNKYEAARVWRWFYLFPHYLLKLIGLWQRYTWYTKFLSYQELQDMAAKQGLTLVEYQGLRFLADWIPSVPFNKVKIFYPFTYLVIKKMQWLDEKIMRNKGLGKYCRFHWMVFEKR